MPTDTPDQQITKPVDADTADNPVAFNSSVADIEQRLVRMYTDEADRTARMLVLNNGSLSMLTAPTVGSQRTEVYDGTNHVSLFTRSVWGRNRKTADQNVGPSNTVLANITGMSIPLPGTTGAIFQFEAVAYYNSNTTADIKFAFTIPAGATMRWGGTGLSTGAGSVSGDATFPSITGSGTSAAFGGAAADAWAYFQGEVTMGVTAGNLQLQAAQQTSDASATNVLARSRIMAYRIL